MTKLLIAAGVLLAVLIVVYFTMNRKQGSPDPAMQRLGQLTELAERSCLSNTTDTTSVNIRVRLEAVKAVQNVGASAGIEEQRRAARGAAEALAGEVQKVENAEIRACMEPWSKQIREMAATL